MTISRILRLVSLVIVAAAIVSVVTSWSDDDAASTLSTSEAAEQTPAPAGSTPGVPDESAPLSSSLVDDAADGDEDAPTGSEPQTTAAPTRPTRPAFLPARTATVVFTGEITPDDTVQRLARHYAGGGGAARDFVPMFADAAAEIAAADLAICHLEWPLSTQPSVGVGPAELAPAVGATGWDGCSVASDSTARASEFVRTETASLLADSGVVAAGDGSSAAHDANGIAVAHLAFTVPSLDATAIIAEAGAALDAGAEFVVVSLHWGDEFEAEPTAEQQQLAAALAASGEVDLVVGHHAHVIQPLDRVEGMWVAYGLGNFLTSQSSGCCGISSEDGVILHIEIGDTADGVAVIDIGYTATWVDRVHMKVHPVVSRLADAGLPAWYRAVLRNSWERTDDALLALGADEWAAAPLDQLP